MSKTPILCVLGNVDVGKTSLLDALRNTNVQEKEEGRITQSISGTNIQKKEIEYYFSKFKTKKVFNITIPGILLIDTPGHESFVSLRQLGSSLCNMAILVVDIRKGPEKQTVEAIKLLEASKIPYIIALNKIDTIYGWKSTEESPFTISFKNQKEHTIDQFNKLIMQNFCMMAENGVNAKLYTEIPNLKEWTPMVPISAKTKEGFSDLIAVIVKMSDKYIGPSEDNIVSGIILEKYEAGQMISIILTDGTLHRGDMIYIKERQVKVKNIQAYNHLTRKTEQLKEVSAAFCCSITINNNLDIMPGDRFSNLDTEVTEEISNDINNEIVCNTGIFIQADSIGSLLALSYVLKQHNIPVKNYAIGTIRQKNIMYALKNCEPKVILGFNVKIEKGINMPDIKDIVVFTDNIVFHLVNQYTKYLEEYTRKIREEKKSQVVWPCILQIEKNAIFRKKDPLIFAVKVTEGKLCMGTPLSTFKTNENKEQAKDKYKDNPKEQAKDKLKDKHANEINIGKVTSIRNTNDVDIEIANTGQTVVIKVEGDSSITFGRHLTEESILYSRITRESLDCLKSYFADDITRDCLDLLVQLKKKLNL